MSWFDDRIIGVVGATGLVGRTMLDVLAADGVPADQVRVFASAASAGSFLDYAGVQLTVADAAGNLSDLDVALLSAGNGPSKTLIPRLVDAGVVCIDNSSAWRRDPAVPLVVPEVNPDDIFTHRGVIANPNCSTIQAVVALAPLLRAFGADRVSYTTYQAVSGAGRKGLDALVTGDGEVFRRPITGNVVARIGAFGEDGFSEEEAKMIHETRKICHTPELPVTATCARVPVANGHCVSIDLACQNPVSPEEARELLAAAPGIRLADFPDPLQVSGRDDVTVGRIRRDSSMPHGLHLWTVADNLRKGAASNAVQIARVWGQGR